MDLPHWLGDSEAWLSSPWSLAVLALVVFADSYTVVLPGEAVLTALGAIAETTGSPQLWAVVLVAASAAYLADISLYFVGRSVGITRWKWMQTPRIARLLEWAADRLHRRSGSVMFVARFIPYARIAVNLTAGATRVPLRRFLPLVGLAALGWATYQALIGAVVSQIVPGGPLVAVAVSIVIALTLGLFIDRILERAARLSGSA